MARMGKAPITKVKSIVQKVGGGVKKDSVNRELVSRRVTVSTKPTRDAYKAIARKEVPLAPYKDQGSLRKPAVVAQMKALKSKKK